MSRHPAHRPRNDGKGAPIVTRQAAAHYAGRHPDQITRHCSPVACDVATRLPLYDLDAVLAKLATLRRKRAA